MITTTSIMNKENYILILVWFLFLFLSGVLEFCTHVLGLQDVNGEGENELYFTHHGQKTKIGGVRATTTTLLRNRCVRETDRERRVRER